MYEIAKLQKHTVVGDGVDSIGALSANWPKKFGNDFDRVAAPADF